MSHPKVFQKVEIAFWIAFVTIVKRKNSFSFSSFLLIGGFLLGAAISIAGVVLEQYESRWSYSSTSSADAVLRTHYSNGQNNTLIILMDSASKKNPNLEGIWLGVSLPDQPLFTFLPIFPTPNDSASGGDKRLTGIFALDRTGAPLRPFLNELSRKDIWWDEIVILDHRSLMQLIQASGGVDLGNGKIDGIEVVAKLPFVKKNPRAALRLQAAIGQQICQKAIEIFNSPVSAANLKNYSIRLLTSNGIAVQRESKHWESLPSCEFPLFDSLPLSALLN